MKPAPIFTAGITACSVMLLAACSGSPNAGPTLPGSPASRLAAPDGFTLDGNSTSFFNGPQSRLMRSLRAIPAKSKVEKDFFVSTTGPEVLIYSNKTYGETGELTNGLSATDGVWVDKKGNIYVANVPTNVVEFKKSGSAPICTYTGATDPDQRYNRRERQRLRRGLRSRFCRRVCPVQQHDREAIPSRRCRRRGRR